MFKQASACIPITFLSREEERERERERKPFYNNYKHIFNYDFDVLVVNNNYFSDMLFCCKRCTVSPRGRYCRYGNVGASVPGRLRPVHSSTTVEFGR